MAVYGVESFEKLISKVKSQARSQKNTMSICTYETMSMCHVVPLAMLCIGKFLLYKSSEYFRRHEYL